MRAVNARRLGMRLSIATVRTGYEMPSCGRAPREPRSNIACETVAEPSRSLIHLRDYESGPRDRRAGANVAR